MTLQGEGRSMAGAFGTLGSLDNLISYYETNGRLSYADEALQIWRYPDDFSTADSIIQGLRDSVLRGDGFYRQSHGTITRYLVDKAVPLITNWMRDERNLFIKGGKMPGPTPPEQGQMVEMERGVLDELERRLRGELPVRELENFIQNCLLHGIGVFAAGLNDAPYSVAGGDLFFDWTQGHYIACKRFISSDDLEMLARTGPDGWGDPDGGFVGFRTLALAQKEMQDAENMFVDMLPDGSGMTAEMRADADRGIWQPEDKTGFGNRVAGEIELAPRRERPPVREGVLDDGHQVIHGNALLDDEWWEFVRDDADEIYVKKLGGKGNFFYHIYKQDAHSKEPLGVYRLVRGMELTRQRCETAIRSRLNNTIDASLLLPKGFIPEQRKQDVYSSAVIEYDLEPMAELLVEGDITKVMSFMDSRAGEIEHFQRAIDALFVEAEKRTGLEQLTVRPAGVTGDVTATEALIQYVDATPQLRELVDGGTRAIGNMMVWLAWRDYGIEFDFEIQENPVDTKLSLYGAQQLLPQMIEILKADADGSQLGGPVNGESIYRLMVRVLQGYKLPSDIVQRPRADTPMNDGDEGSAAQQRIAEAAMKTAEAEHLKGQAAMTEAEAAVVSAVLGVHKAKADVENKDDLVVARLAQALIQADAKGEQISLQALKTVIDGLQVGDAGAVMGDFQATGKQAGKAVQDIGGGDV